MTELLYDIHTHTVYSHGHGRITDNAEAAAKAGLRALGISDHGPGHKGYGISMKKIPSMRADIESARLKYPDLEITLGLEANIYNPSGKLDVSGEDIKLFDYIIAGYHYGTVSGEAVIPSIRMIIGGYTACRSSRQTHYNTDLVLAALYENDIRVLTHPGEKASFDIDEIARACERTGTLMEINDHHQCLTVDGIRTAMKYDVKFIIGSDAHVPEAVGCFERALARADEAGLERSRIVNLSERSRD